MITKEQKMLKKLEEKIGESLLTHKLGISPRTLGRWIEGKPEGNKPPFSARRLIAQIYNGYKAQEVK